MAGFEVALEEALAHADSRPSVIRVKITLNLDEALLTEASDYTGLREKTALLHEGLRALIQRETVARLAALGGKDRKAAAAPRRKPVARA